MSKLIQSLYEQMTSRQRLQWLREACYRGHSIFNVSKTGRTKLVSSEHIDLRKNLRHKTEKQGPDY